MEDGEGGGICFISFLLACLNTYAPTLNSPFLEEVVPEETSKAETPQADNAPTIRRRACARGSKGDWAVGCLVTGTQLSQPEARNVASLRELVFAEHQQ